MRVLSVEDDTVQAGSLETALSNTFTEVSVTRVATVQELRAWLQGNESAKLDLVILDGIIPWMRPSPESVDNLPGSVLKTAICQNTT